MKKIIEYINNKILKNKKLWLVCAAFMSLFMCLPTTAYAHGGEIVFVFIAWGIYAIVMLLITVISIKFPNFFILILNIIILFFSIVSFVLLPLTFLPVINIILILIMMTTPKYLIKYGKVEELKEKIEKGLDVNKKISKDTMLCYALRLDEVEIAKMLIGKNADINIKGNWGWTPLYIVVDSGNIELIKLLILKDADVNVKNDLGSSPLHRAVLNNRKDIVEILLAKGADLNAKDNLEDTPLDKAETGDIKQLLISRGAKSGKDLK